MEKVKGEAIMEANRQKRLKRILICAVLITVCFFWRQRCFKSWRLPLDYSESPDYRDVLYLIYEGTKKE